MNDSLAEGGRAIATLRSWGVRDPAAPQRWGQALLIATLGLSCCEVWSGAIPLGRPVTEPSVQGPTVITITDASSSAWRVATRVLVTTGSDAERESLDEAVLAGAALAGEAQALLAASSCGKGPRLRP